MQRFGTGGKAGDTRQEREKEGPEVRLPSNRKGQNSNGVHKGAAGI